MPAVEVRDLNQRAVYWEIAGLDNYGEVTVKQPDEIICRLILKSGDALDSQGQKISIDGTLIACKCLKMNSLVAEGKFSDLESDTFAPTENTMIIVGVNHTPDLKNRNIRYNYLLKRYKATTPTPVN